MRKETSKAMENLEKKSWQKGKGFFYTVPALNHYILILFLDDNQMHHLVLSIDFKTTFLSSESLIWICEKWYAQKIKK